MAGAHTLWRPAITAASLGRMGGRSLDSSGAVLNAAAIAVGAVELAGGLAVWVVGGAVVMALAGVGFFALAIVAWWLWRLSPSEPCGCLGSSAPPRRWNVVLNAVVGLGCVAAAVVGAVDPLVRGGGSAAARALSVVAVIGLVSVWIGAEVAGTDHRQ